MDWILNQIFSIQTPLSYKLYPSDRENSTWQNGVAMEVNPVTRQLDATKEIESVGDLLPDIVGRTMKEVFREEGSKVIHSYLEGESNLKLEEIAEKPEEFSTSLERLLGSGAPVIEKMILKSLCLELCLEYEGKQDYQFSDYVKELNRSVLVEG